MTDYQKKQRILIVDDNPENIDILDSILKSAYKINAALNGDTAIRIANSDSSPDLILLDVSMPGMDGYSVCELLKKIRLPVRSLSFL
jgi:putative two-component system response regulator